MKENDLNNDSFESLMNESVSSQFSWFKTLSIVGLIALSIFLGFFLCSVYQDNVLISSDQLDKESLSADTKDDGLLKKEHNANTEKLIANNNPDSLGNLNIPTSQLTRPKNMSTTVSEETVPALESIPVKEIKANGFYRVIAKSFTDLNSAASYRKKLQAQGFKPYVWIAEENNKPVYKVQMGAFKSLKRAETHKKRLEKKNLSTYILNK